MPPRKKKQQLEGASQYRYLQLIDGTELISIVHDGDDSSVIRLEDPLRIVIMTPFLENSSDGSHTIMLTPWIVFTEDLYISVNTDKVLVIATATDKLIYHYKKVVAMIVKRAMKEEFDIMDRAELPDFERELQESDNPLQDLVDSLKQVVENKKKNITYH